MSLYEDKLAMLTVDRTVFALTPTHRLIWFDNVRDRNQTPAQDTRILKTNKCLNF